MKKFVDILLKDRTTGKNILWANVEFGNEEIQPAQIELIEPRWKKNREQQKLRTRQRAEIFTPPEVCKLQNDSVDAAWIRNVVEPWLSEKNYTEALIVDALTEKISAAWFRRNDISSTPETSEDTFVANFLNAHENLWRAYVTARRLEIACGEAPYLADRYNVVTGEPIELFERGGLLDRKLRVVGKNTSTETDWLELATQAVQSCYGYEFQGDNLFLARRNVFETVKDYFVAKFNREPPEDFLSEVAEIISWNLWQMDGLSKTFSPPFTEGKSLFGGANCLIKDWTTGNTVEFQTLVKGARR